MYAQDAVDKLISNLQRIPKEIDTKMFIEEISRALSEELNNKLSL